MPRRPTTSQKIELTNKRRKLRNRILAFSKDALHFLGEEAIDSIYDTDQLVLDEDVSDDENEDLGNPDITDADPEHQQLPFPSAVPHDHIRSLSVEQKSSLSSLRETELQIRRGHGDDSLDQVRTAVIHLSWQFKNKVRKASSVVQTTRAWDKVKALNRVWKLQRRVYNYNRTVMMQLGDKDVIGVNYPFLELSDCKVSTAISNPNAPGQSSDRLPWFWKLSGRVAGSVSKDADYQNECKSL
jgi:hypothetical protein